jgi:O-methyltransferase
MDQLFLCDSFPNIFKQVLGKTLLSRANLKVLYQLSMSVRWIDGAVAEVGVWRGGALFLLAKVCGGKRIYGFDSWEGLPKPTIEDKVDDARLASEATWRDVDYPIELFAEFGRRVLLVKGWFENTFARVGDDKFVFVHLDCDRYKSIKQSLGFFDKRMVSGGLILIHDFSSHVTPGVEKAVVELWDSLNFIQDYNCSDYAGLILRY